MQYRICVYVCMRSRVCTLVNRKRERRKQNRQQTTQTAQKCGGGWRKLLCHFFLPMSTYISVHLDTDAVSQESTVKPRTRHKWKKRYTFFHYNPLFSCLPCDLHDKLSPKRFGKPLTFVCCVFAVLQPILKFTSRLWVFSPLSMFGQVIVDVFFNECSVYQNKCVDIKC